MYEVKLVVFGGLIFALTEMYKFSVLGHLSIYPDFGLAHVVGFGMMALGVVLFLAKTFKEEE